MHRATRVLPAGAWSGRPIDRVVLDHTQRHRRRVTMTGVGGWRFLLDLPNAITLRDGDGIEFEDGRIVVVEARKESLVAITAPDAAGLIRLAWHLGNRHLPADIGDDHILIRHDPVIESMVLGLGGTVTPVSLPFDPEGGAYSSDEAGRLGHAHDHHGHGHGHDHRQAADPAPYIGAIAGQAHAQSHVVGHARDHDSGPKQADTDGSDAGSSGSSDSGGGDSGSSSGSSDS